jgi:hypothetical protein
MNPWGIGPTLEKVARSAAAYGQPRCAVHFFATAHALYRSFGYVLEYPERAGHGKYLAMVRGRLDDGSFAAAWAEGQALPLELAVAEEMEEFGKYDG